MQLGRRSEPKPGRFVFPDQFFFRDQNRLWACTLIEGPSVPTIFVPPVPPGPSFFTNKPGAPAPPPRRPSTTQDIADRLAMPPPPPPRASSQAATTDGATIKRPGSEALPPPPSLKRPRSEALPPPPSQSVQAATPKRPSTSPDVINAWRVRLQRSHPPVSKHGTAISKAAIVAHDISPKQLLAMGSGPSGVIVDYTYEEESEEEDEKANDECGQPVRSS